MREKTAELTEKFNVKNGKTMCTNEFAAYLWIILRNSIHGGMGWWYKRPNFFQLFNLFYHQENFAGSTICHENYDN